MSGNYSFSLTTFSPSGKLGQIEHALNAVNQGVTSIGIKVTDRDPSLFFCFLPTVRASSTISQSYLSTSINLATNGVVIATEKKSASTLIDDSSIEKVAMVCDSIGMVYSGMGPDFRLLVSRARKYAQQYKQLYMENPPTRILVEQLARVMQDYTHRGGVRPFGVSLLIVGYDDVSGPSLYQVDPSGSYWAWKASAIGKNMINAKSFLEKRYNDEIELEDAVHTAILTLKEGFEGQMTETSLEIGIIGISTIGVAGKDREQFPLFRKLSPSEVKDYLANIA
ncbi:unnamed protein product [Umbelopsis vinacea]